MRHILRTRFMTIAMLLALGFAVLVALAAVGLLGGRG